MGPHRLPSDLDRALLLLDTDAGIGGVSRTMPRPFATLIAALLGVLARAVDERLVDL